MDPRVVNTGIVQMQCSPNKAENLEKALSGIRDAAAKGAQIICLQELFASLYFCNTEDPAGFEWAEPLPGPTLTAIQKAAAELEVVVIASLFEKRAPGLFHNSTAVIDADGSFLGIYRKSHIPDDPGFCEKYYFAPGDTGYRVFETRYAKCGVLICWDQWYPEAARITALQGAEILFYPTAIGWDIQEHSESLNREQFEAWQTIQRSHAIANGIPVVSVNRVGKEAGTLFWGGSFICNPFGTLLCSADHHEETTLVSPVNLNESDYYRQTWPFLRDRRIDTYSGILERYLDKKP